ncbi:hypothetical protein BO068_004668 [Escherichia coli]|nr:hypothetical protein [Escherichia coli]
MTRTVDLIPFGLGRTIQRMRRERQVYLTERALGALPDYLRQDIGWPDRTGRRRDVE